jgi:hypothetical protein
VLVPPKAAGVGVATVPAVILLWCAAEQLPTAQVCLRKDLDAMRSAGLDHNQLTGLGIGNQSC